MNKPFYFILLLVFASNALFAQKTQQFNLSQLLESNKLVSDKSVSIADLTEGNYHGISFKNGLLWLKDIRFANGTIEADIKGRDVLQQSFLGIAFHGVDTSHFDLVYIRPFNFQSADTLRKKHAIQYISAPDYPWERLRAEHPLVYENPVAPPLSPIDWVHISIVVQDGIVSVYLNHAAVPSLKIKKLNDQNDGLLGVWAFGQEQADFANLIIKKKN